MKKIITLVAFTCILSTAIAQQQKGDFQLQGQGSYFSFAGFNSGSLFVNFSSFVTDNIEVGASPFFTFSDETTVNLAFYSNYSFLTQDAKMVPYLGAQIMFYGLGGTASSNGFGFRGGLRYFITENVNIDVGPNLIFLEGETLFVFNAGLGFIFGKK